MKKIFSSYSCVMLMVLIFLVGTSGSSMAEVLEDGDAAARSMRDFGELGWLVDESGFEEAISKFEENERPFLVYAVNDECVEVCELFEETVLLDPNVKDLTLKFTKVVINVNSYPDFGKRFGLEKFPSLLVMRNSRSAQRVPITETEEDEPVYDPAYVIERLRMSGLK